MTGSSDLENIAIGVNGKHADGISMDPINLDYITKFTSKQQDSILWRIDCRLIITLGALYFVSLMDRTNLGNAAIAGMTLDLKMGIEGRYSIVTLVFFIPYVLFQAPATVVIRKIGPRIFLTMIVLAWGVVMICFGFSPNWQTMAGLRVILGVLEAGLFPGSAYLLSTWYCRYELQKRNACFYLIGSIAPAFAGILAYGITQMNGLSGLAGWKWIFIIEGILTCVIGLIGYIFIVNFPELSKESWGFLSDAETDFVVARIQLDRQDVLPEPFNLGAYLRNGLDIKVWGFACLYMLSTTTSYAIAFFLPIILRNGLGFSIAKSQCLVAPPYVLAALVMISQAYFSDKLHLRSPFIIGNAMLGLVGLPLLGYSRNNAVRYFGVFLATTAGNANIPAVLTYQANNVRGQWKRAFSSATLVGAGGIGGIIGSTIFRDVDAPNYGPGIIGTIIASGLTIVITLALTLSFWRANKRVEAGTEVLEHQEGFKYTL